MSRCSAGPSFTRSDRRRDSCRTVSPTGRAPATLGARDGAATTWVCEQIGPELRGRGLVFTGIDVIGEFMTELNVTSPTCIRELERASDLRIAKQVLDAVASRLG